MSREYKYIRKDIQTNDYVEIMAEACVENGLKDVVINYDIIGDYQGDYDMEVEGTFKGKKVIFFYRQSYGSCSYCDWLESSGSEKVLKEYIKEVKHILEELEGE